MLERLTKHELLHLVKDMRNERDVINEIRQSLDYQDKHNIKCWDCESIARKLELKR